MAFLDQLERRSPDWPAAAVAGLGAGAILMVLDLLWSFLVTGAGPWHAARMIAAIATGPQVLESSGFSLPLVTFALLMHYTFGVVGGLVFAAVSSPLGLDSRIGIAVLTGMAFGFVLYIINFHVMVVAFPWFAEIRGWAALAINLIFGVSTAILYYKLERRSEARSPLPEAR